MAQATVKQVRLAGLVSAVPAQLVSNLDCPPEKRQERERLVRNIGIDTRRVCGEGVVFSDLAPKTTGIKDVDEARSLRLVGVALDVSRNRGRVGSHFIAKLFMGGGFEDLREELRTLFADVKVVRPEATRGASMEIYLVGLRKR